MMHYTAGSSIRRWVHGVIKGWHGQQQYSGRLWCLNDAQLVLKGPKCAKKIFPTPLHHHQPEPLRQSRMDPCFHDLYTKFWPYHLNVTVEIEIHQTRQCFPIFYCPILVSLCELLPLFSVLSWPERHPVWSSAAVAHLLQGSMCCAEMVFCKSWLKLLIFWVTVDFLSSLSSLSILLWPLTSTRHFRSLDIFSFLNHSL